MHLCPEWMNEWMNELTIVAINFILNVCGSHESIAERFISLYLYLDFVLFAHEPLSRDFFIFTALICIFWSTII